MKCNGFTVGFAISFTFLFNLVYFRTSMIYLEWHPMADMTLMMYIFMLQLNHVDHSAKNLQLEQSSILNRSVEILYSFKS